VNAHPWDPTLAQSVQEILNRTAPEEQILRDLIQRLNSDPGLNHIDLINPGLRGGSPVPRAFTAPAWAKASAFISEHSSARGADCHRRAADTEQRETYCRRLSDGYMLKYRNAWAHAFKALQTDPGNNLRELQESISTLAEPNDNPLQNVFDLIDENTQRLPTISCRTSKELAATAMRQRSLVVAQDPEADPARRIAQYFAPLLSYARTPPPPKGTKTPKKKSPSSLPIDDYKSHLTKLLPAIKAAIDNPEQLTPLAESAKRDLDQIVYQIDVGNYGLWREPLKDLLLPPFKQIIVDATDAAAIKLNKDWCDEVILPMRQSLVGRYPFVADSKQNASLAELDKYFHPEKGAIARFRDTHLASRLEISPTGVRARPVALGAERHLTDTLVDFLDDAHKLGILLYDDAQQIGVDLTMLPTCAQLDPSRRNEIHRLTLDLGGGEDDKHSFICSTKNTSRPFRWPGKESEKSPTILLVVGKETGEDKLLQAGAFGLFRLLERRPPRRREHSHTLIAIHPFLKYGDVELEYIPTLRQGGTLFFGFDRTNTRFLAPLRTRALVTPPSQIFREIDFTCGSAP
jgi:type VI secretion system protein ImpL